MNRHRIAHAIGFDDCPFDRDYRGDVRIVGAVMSGDRLDGVLSGKVRRDGANSARQIAAMINSSRFSRHLQLVMLQGIALAGFNVVDVFHLHRATGLPILVIARKEPHIDEMKKALLTRLPGGSKKWRIIERLGPMETVRGIRVQRIAITLAESEAVIKRFSIHSSIPEPLRVAHLVAGGIEHGESRGRV